MSALLQVCCAAKHFGGLRAVDDISFELGAGEIVSLIGPNGAGKTTLFNLLTGQLAPSHGQILFDGQDIGRLRPHQRARLGLGRTFQIAQTLTSMTVLENAMIGAFLHHAGLSVAAAQAMTALEAVGLAPRAAERADALTLGERRRLEVARALAMQPRVMLLDEVMAGLNQTEVEEIIDMVRRLNSQGMTFLVIEHNLKVVRAFSRRVIVLNRGRMLAQGSAEEVLASPDVITAYLGKSA
jgi:branched-chain amino acid transport system ATP-binding protein